MSFKLSWASKLALYTVSVLSFKIVLPAA